MTKLLYTREEAAELLSMSESWVKAEIRAGRMESVKLGKAVRVKAATILQLIENRTVEKTVGTPCSQGQAPPSGAVFQVVEKNGIAR